jgi:multimeric flavodoxin WrbA
MKAVILNGGPRKSGATSQILKHIEGMLAKTCSVENVFVYKQKIKPCIGCLKCRPDKKCALPKDDAHKLAKTIKDADILIVGTPTYWGNMTGPLKNLFDRCVPTFEYIDGASIKKMQKGKVSLLVTTSGSPFPINRLPNQSKGAIRSISTVLRAGGYKILKSICVGSSYAFDGKKDKVFRNIDRIINSNARHFASPDKP